MWRVASVAWVQVIDFYGVLPFYAFGTYLAIELSGSWQHPWHHFLSSQGEWCRMMAIEIQRIFPDRL
jgi:hypothetical protein